MNKKTYIILLSIISMLVVSTVNVSAYDGTLNITDEINDIIKAEEDGTVSFNNTYPDVDFETLSLKQIGKQVDVTVKLAEGGEFQEDLTTFYVIVILTTSPYGEYDIFYSGALAIEAGSPLIILSYTSDEGLEAIDDYTGKGTDTLQFSFDLMDRNERLISALVMITKDDYSDVYPYNIEDIEDIEGITDIEINAGGSYNIKTNQDLQLSGTVISGEITNDHEWFWTFDDSSITLEGKNPSYNFKIPDTYTGTLYVYDGEGSWGKDTFQVNVTGTSTNGGNNNNNEPGFELIIVIAAVAIALLILRKKKNN